MPTFQPGDVVVTGGLRSRADLNSVVGRVVSYNGDSDRYAVLLNDQSAPMLFRPQNIRRFGEDDDGDDDDE